MSMNAKKKGSFFFRHGKLDCLNCGLAMIFILLLVMLIGKHEDVLLLPTLGVTLLLMIKPTLFQPFAALWLGFSEVMGGVMSKIILSLVFFLVVTPIALIRGVKGADAMQFKKFKQGTDSVFRVREGKLTPADLEHMF